MRRVIVALSIDDDGVTPANLADDISYGVDSVTDPTVWEWPDFWADVADGVVSPSGDKTSRCLACGQIHDPKVAGDCADATLPALGGRG